MPVFDPGPSEGSIFPRRGGLGGLIDAFAGAVPAAQTAFESASARRVDRERIAAQEKIAAEQIAVQREQMVQDAALAAATRELEQQRIAIAQATQDLAARTALNDERTAAVALSREFGIPVGQLFGKRADGTVGLSLANIQDKTAKHELEQRREILRKFGVPEDDILRQLGAGASLDAASLRELHEAQSEQARGVGESSAADAALKRQRKELIDRMIEQADATGTPLSSMFNKSGRAPLSYAEALKSASGLAGAVRLFPYRGVKVGGHELAFPEGYALDAASKIADVSDAEAFKRLVRRQLAEQYVAKAGARGLARFGVSTTEQLRARLDAEGRRPEVDAALDELIGDVVPVPGNKDAVEQAKAINATGKATDVVDLIARSLQKRVAALRQARGIARSAIMRNPDAAADFHLLVPELLRGMEAPAGAGAPTDPTGGLFDLGPLGEQIDSDSELLDRFGDAEEPPENLDE